MTAREKKQLVKKNNQPLVKIDKGDKWYNHVYNEKLAADETLPAELVNKLDAKAISLLVRDTQLSAGTRGKAEANVAWITQIIKSGTSSDKISAVQLDSQIDPVHSLDNIKFLVGWLQKKTMREVIPVLTALKDIFINELLPENRKLVAFKDRPLHQLEKLASGNQQTLEKRLILWKFEADLKKCYAELVHALDSICNSSVEAVVLHTCRTMKELLAQRPEQEQVLLGMLSNKLCMPKKAVASKASDMLYELVEAHPNMRTIVVTEVEKVMYRKNVPLKAQLYAAHFMSRILFNKGDEKLAMKLLRIYFSMFKTLLQSAEENHRIMALVMIGASRAIPYAKDNVKELIPEIDSLYKMVHSDKFSIALAALKVLFQILTFNEDLSDRFYSAFYRRLANVRSSSHDVELFALLEKVIIADTVVERTKAFLKRLLQLALVSNPAFAAACLLLYGKVAEKQKGIVTTAIVKNTSYQSKSKFERKFADEDEDEHYGDADKVEIKVEEKVVQNGNNIKQVKEKGWLHRLVAPKAKAKPDATVVGYDAEARNPLFANTAMSVDTELYQLSQHFHPSVAIYAQKLIDGEKIEYKGDPLEDFTLIRFLDRFTFKNPKQKKDRQSVLSHKYTPQGVKSIGVASKDYVNKKVKEVPLDERYLHHYASLTMKAKPEDEFDDIASINSDEFEMVMDQFEPGEANEDFSINFGEMFGPEKTVKDKKSKKRQGDELDAMDNEDASEDEVSDAEFKYSDDDDDNDFDDDDEADFDDDDDEEEDEEMFLDDEKVEKSKKAVKKPQKGLFDTDDSEDEEDEDHSKKLAKDALASADIFDDIMDNDDEEKPSKKKKKIHKPKGFKKRKNH